MSERNGDAVSATETDKKAAEAAGHESVEAPEADGPAPGDGADEGAAVTGSDEAENEEAEENLLSGDGTDEVREVNDTDGSGTGTGEAGADDAGTRAGAGQRIVAALTAPARGFRRRLDQRPRRVLTELTVAVVICAVLAGGLWAFSLVSSSNATGRTDAVAAAQRTTTALLSYDPQSVNGLVDRLGGDLTEGFRTDYGTLMSQVIAPATAQQQITTEAEVVGTSVVPEETGGDRLVALLFVNQTTRTGQEGAPRVAGSRVKVTMDDVDGRWLVADVKPV